MLKLQPFTRYMITGVGWTLCFYYTDVLKVPFFHIYIHTYMFVVVNFDALAQASDIRIERRQVFEPKVSDTYSPADWMPADKPTELSRIKLKTWTRQPVPMISKHSAHSTSLPVGFRTWLWRYTCLLLLISMLWHRQAIFESKGDKLSSSAECRIRTQGTTIRFLKCRPQSSIFH